MTNVQIKLPEGLALAKGDLSWLGDIPANGIIEVKSVIKAINVGNWTIEATAGYSVTEDSYYGDVDRLYISVSEDSAYVSETPILEYADLAERVDAPPDVAGLSLEGITPNARAPTQKSLPPESPGTLTVTGRFWCYISEDTVPSPGQMRNDELQPMSWGNVWIYRSSDDAYLGGDITGPKDSLEEGYFEISIENPGDAGFYVAMLPWTSACHVTKPDDSEYISYTSSFYPSPSATTYDIGGWRPPDQWDYMGAWRIYESIARDHYDRGAWDFMANEGPGYAPPEVQVRFKMSDGHGTHIHLDSGVIDIDTADFSRALDIVQHEYGHWVMYNAYNGYWPPNTGGTHYINRISNPNMAWTEGWANFFPLAVQSYGRWEDSIFEWGTGSQYDLETCPDCDSGDQCEGRVAGALWDVFDSQDDGYDRFTDGISNIWNVISSQTDDTYAEFYSAWRSMGKDRHMLNFCSYQNTIDYNNSPRLTDGQISPLPDPIYPDTELGFWVYYRDDDHDPANIVRVYIYDGGWSYYSMDHYSGDPATGEWFRKPLSGFSPGDHDYFFYATDDMDEDYDPDSGYYRFYVAEPPQYLVTFYTNPVADSPSITFDGTIYIHGQSGSYSSGDYLATANPPSADYVFHHWVYSGSPGVGVYVPNININPTTVEVRGNGWLKAVFSAKITFHTNPPGMGSITYDGNTFVDGDNYWEPNLPPDYGNIRTITANPLIDYTFVSWEATGKIYISDPFSTTTTLTVEGPGALTANFQALIAPSASFTYSPAFPLVGEIVTFDASASYDPDGFIVSYVWDFGDGNTGSGVVVTLVYTTHGTYTVTLTVTDNDGLTDSTTAQITVYAPPVASFTYSPPAPLAGELVTFDASASYDPDGIIVSYNWDFGDGSTGTGMILDHTYAAAGTYTVNLSVTDNDGLKDFVVHLVKVYAPPVASFTYSPSEPLVGELVTFNSTSYDVDGVLVSWEWDLDGDSIVDVTTENATWTYTAHGTYTVTLTVTDNDGLTDSTTAPVTVYTPISEVKIDPSVKNVTRGEIFEVNVTVTDVVDLYLWIFSIRWDSSVLNITNIAEGPFLQQGGPTTFMWAEINYAGGYVREATCTLLGPIPGVSGSGTIAIITFEALTEGASPLDLYDVVLLDSLGNAIPINVVDGEVNVAPPLDLILQNIELPYSEAKLYANVTSYPISVTIINDGTVDAGAFNVSFSAYWEDGMITEYWNKTRVQNLGAGSTIILQFYFMPQHIGNYTITINVDCDNDIHPELDETNNTQQILIFATIAGDIDTDGDVDYQDLFILARSYGSSPGGPPYHLADFNCDGEINYLDLFILARNYGKST